MRIISKSAFARLCNVQPSAVSNWIANGILSGEALVGEGRTARINVDVARVQVNQRRDIGQALGNGLKVRLRPEATPAVVPPPAPAEACTIPDAQTTRRLFFEGVLCLAYDLPQAIAIGAYDAGTPRADAERIEMVVRDGIRSEVGHLARLYGPQAGLTFADLFDESRFSRVHWDAVEDERDNEL